MNTNTFAELAATKYDGKLHLVLQCAVLFSKYHFMGIKWDWLNRRVQIIKDFNGNVVLNTFVAKSFNSL